MMNTEYKVKTYKKTHFEEIDGVFYKIDYQGRFIGTYSDLTKEELTEAKKLAGCYVINNSENKIEFSDGTTYAKDFYSGTYRKAKIFVL